MSLALNWVTLAFLSFATRLLVSVSAWRRMGEHDPEGTVTLA